MARIKYREAIGLDVKRGKPSIGKKPRKSELKRLYIKESKSTERLLKSSDVLKMRFTQLLRNAKLSGGQMHVGPN